MRVACRMSYNSWGLSKNPRLTKRITRRLKIRIRKRFKEKLGDSYDPDRITYHSKYFDMGSIIGVAGIVDLDKEGK